MVDQLVLVNGLPGSGKTSLAPSLAGAMSAPLIAKDAIKEAVADLVSAASAAALGAAAMEMAWSLTASIPGPVVLESWWFKPRDLSFVEAGVTRCGRPAVVEVWCDVPVDVARGRYAVRQRHAIHNDTRQLADSWPRWAAEAEPLGIGRVIMVRTDRPVDIAELAARVAAAFADRPALA